MSTDIRLITFGLSSTTGNLTTQDQIMGLQDAISFVAMTDNGLPPSVPNYSSLLGTHTATIQMRGVAQFTGVRITIASINAVTVPATIPLTAGTQQVQYTITQSMVDQLTTDSEDPVNIQVTVMGATGTIQTFNSFVDIDSSSSGKFDEDAIHDDVAGEINALTTKTTVADADVFIIEDSADSFNKKKVLASAVGTGGGSATPTQQEFIRVRPNAAQTLNTTTETEITFVTVDQNTNTERFTVTSGNVNVLQASRYLINVKTSIEVTDTSGSQRVDPITRVRVNGTALAPRSYGHYARNSQVSPSVMHSSDDLTFVADLAANDVVDVVLQIGDLTTINNVDTVIDGTYLEIIELVGTQGIQGVQGPAGADGVDGGIDSWASLTGTITNAQIMTTLDGLGYGGTNEVFKATSLTAGLEDAVQLPTDYNTYRTVRVIQIDDSELRLQELPIYLLTDTNLTSTTVIRVQGDTDLTFDSSNRMLSVPGGAAIIYQVTLEN